MSMAISVGLRGNTRLAKRLADAVSTQSDMRLVGVSDWSHLTRLAASRGYAMVDSAEQLSSDCDVFVDLAATGMRISGPRLSPSAASPDTDMAFTALINDSHPFTGKTLVVPSADAVALARVVRAIRRLGNVVRLFSNVISRAAHAADDARFSLDALEPSSDETALDTELAEIFAGVIEVCQTRRVVAPYTHSHLHLIKLDLDRPIERDDIATALKEDSRILVASANDGFRTTADINEFFRDLGRTRGDRWEAFVWDESVMVNQQSVILMLDVVPDALALPEGLDAIRWFGRPDLALSAIQQLTDDSLGLMRNMAD